MAVVTDRIGLRGEVHLTVVRGDLTPEETGKILTDHMDAALLQRIVSREVIQNLVTNTGRAGVATIMATGTTRPTYIGVGTTVISPAITDTTLAGEINRNIITTSAQFGTYYARWAATFSATDFNNTVRGIASFTSSSGGNMWTIVSANTLKDSNSSLVTDWRVQVTTV